MEQNILDTIPEKGTKDEVVMVVDCSTSMNSIREEAQDGINQFIKEQQEIDGGAHFTLVEFDYKSKIIHERININEVPNYELVPRGMTALCDAIGSAVAAVKETDGKVVIVVVTDGNENASQELDADAVKKLITEKQEAGWEFVFLAANQDAIATGRSYGFDKDATVNFAATGVGATQAYDAASLYTSSLRTKSKFAAVADLKQKIADSDDLD